MSEGTGRGLCAHTSLLAQLWNPNIKTVGFSFFHSWIKFKWYRAISCSWLEKVPGPELHGKNAAFYSASSNFYEIKNVFRHEYAHYVVFVQRSRSFCGQKRSQQHRNLPSVQVRGGSACRRQHEMYKSTSEIRCFLLIAHGQQRRLLSPKPLYFCCLPNPFDILSSTCTALFLHSFFLVLCPLCVRNGRMSRACHSHVCVPTYSRSW